MKQAIFIPKRFLAMALAMASFSLSLNIQPADAQSGKGNSDSLTTFHPGAICQPKYTMNHLAVDHWYNNGRIENASTKGGLMVSCPLPLYRSKALGWLDHSKVKVNISFYNHNRDRPLSCSAMVLSAGGTRVDSGQIKSPYGGSGPGKTIELDVGTGFDKRMLSVECMIPSNYRGYKSFIQMFKVTQFRSTSP